MSGLSAKRCQECNGKFGLIRYWFWRQDFCSKKCLQAFKEKQVRKRWFLRWLYSDP